MQAERGAARVPLPAAVGRPPGCSRPPFALFTPSHPPHCRRTADPFVSQSITDMVRLARALLQGGDPLLTSSLSFGGLGSESWTAPLTGSSGSVKHGMSSTVMIIVCECV